MRIQSASNQYKQQNFGMVTISGSKVSIEHLFKAGSGSSHKVRKLIKETKCSDKEIQAAIFDSIRGLAILDAHSQTVTDIRLSSKPETLLISMRSSCWDEAASELDLSFDDIIKGALGRMDKLSEGYDEKIKSRIDNLTTVLPGESPEEILAEKTKIKELLNIVPPIAQEVGFRFNKVYFALRKSLGLD